MWNLSESMVSGGFTYSNSKYSCIAEMHYVHVLCTYAVSVCGLLCLMTRLIPPLTFTHKIWGRGYIIFMIWTVTSSLLINNTGLPVFVLWGFVTVQLTLSVGWVVIKIHEWQMQRKAMRNVLKAIKMGTDVDDLQAAINYEKSCLAAEKTWWQRILSWKALHGTLFFTSWVNIVGRIFFTPWNPDEWQCYTYPYYKPIDVPTKYNGSSVGELVPVPITDPRMENFPQYQITVMYSVGSIIGCFAVGTIYSCVAAAYHKRNKRTGSISDDKHRHQSSLPLAYSSLPEATIPAAPATTDY